MSGHSVCTDDVGRGVFAHAGRLGSRGNSHGLPSEWTAVTALEPAASVWIPGREALEKSVCSDDRHAIPGGGSLGSLEFLPEYSKVVLLKLVAKIVSPFAIGLSRG